VTKHRRRWNGIASGEKQIGVTRPGGLQVDEDFASDRRSDVHVLEIEPATECVNYKRLHLWPPCSCTRTNLVFQAAGRRAMGWRFAGFKVAVFPESLGLFFFPRSTFVNECGNGYQIRPRHLYYQTDRDKVSEWNCGI
jgi:hypothetical protein